MKEPYLEKTTHQFIKSLSEGNNTPLYELSPQQARDVLLSVQSANLQKYPTTVQEIEVPLVSNRIMRTQIIYPPQTSSPLPVIFYIHGGGWVMGNETTHQRLIHELTLKTPAIVIFPIYSPSPETQYPQTHQDIYSVFQYLLQNSNKYNLDFNNLCIAGDSVGGNMATVISLIAKNNHHIPKIKFQLLLYPVTDAKFDTVSYQKFADGPWLTKKAMQWFWQQYAPNTDSRQEIYASPLLATPEDLQGMPPTLIITDENDVLRDEGEEFARKLDNAGVEVYNIRINQTIHDFMMLDALADSRPTQIAMDITIKYLQKFLYYHSPS